MPYGYDPFQQTDPGDVASYMQGPPGGGGLPPGTPPLDDASPAEQAHRTFAPFLNEEAPINPVASLHAKAERRAQDPNHGDLEGVIARMVHQDRLKPEQLGEHETWAKAHPDEAAQEKESLPQASGKEKWLTRIGMVLGALTNPIAFGMALHHHKELESRTENAYLERYLTHVGMQEQQQYAAKADFERRKFNESVLEHITGRMDSESATPGAAGPATLGSAQKYSETGVMTPDIAGYSLDAASGRGRVKTAQENAEIAAGPAKTAEAIRRAGGEAGAKATANLNARSTDKALDQQRKISGARAEGAEIPKEKAREALAKLKAQLKADSGPKDKPASPTFGLDAVKKIDNNYALGPEQKLATAAEFLEEALGEPKRHSKATIRTLRDYVASLHRQVQAAPTSAPQPSAPPPEEPSPEP